jgi:hypothetical protein
MHAIVGIAQAHHARGVAVVAVAQGKKRVLALHAEVLPVLHGHLHGHFHADRSRVGEKHVREARRRQGNQPIGQELRRRVGEPAQHDVREIVHLRAQAAFSSGWL